MIGVGERASDDLLWFIPVSSILIVLFVPCTTSVRVNMCGVETCTYTPEPNAESYTPASKTQRCKSNNMITSVIRDPIAAMSEAVAHVIVILPFGDVPAHSSQT